MLALIALLVIPAAASAAPRKVPFGFFGTVVAPNFGAPGVFSDQELDRQMALMASSGVETARVPLTWADTETRPGVYNWTRIDRVVAAAARHQISLLVNVLLTPKWASSRPGAPNPYIFPPSDYGRFGAFMSQLVQRFGPTGSFWTLNPSLPRVPLRRWQIWNEQMAPWMWGPRPWRKSYTRLLKAAYRAIHTADRGAKVVPGSLVAYSKQNQWSAMSDLYKAGAKRFFDEIAVHPFTNDPRSVRRTIANTLLIIKRVRARMRAHGQGRLPIMVTELTWPAAVGKVPRRRLLGLETTGKGQVKRMKAGYRQLAKVRRKLGISEVYWFSWASEYDAKSRQSDVAFRFTGLNRFDNGMFSPMPLLGVFSNLARKYEGCPKSTTAGVCR
jgi:hypothetical protein